MYKCNNVLLCYFACSQTEVAAQSVSVLQRVSHHCLFKWAEIHFRFLMQKHRSSETLN